MAPLLQALSSALLDEHRVEEVMRPITVTLPSHTAIPELMSCLLRLRLDRVFIVDQERLVGVVTVTDLLRAAARPGQLSPREAAVRTPLSVTAA